MKKIIELYAFQLIHKISVILKSNMWFFFRQYNSILSNNEYPTIDIVMPLVPKDIIIAKASIESLKKNVINPIDKIIIIGPKCSQLDSFCNQFDLLFVNEDDVSPLTSEEIKNYTNTNKRIGWLKQQLIKLSIHKLQDIRKNVLILDADTILLKKQFFIDSNNFIILFYSDEFHVEYKLANEFMLNKKSYCPLSFISHHQLFNIDHLISLHYEIENLHKKNWYFIFLDAAIGNENYVSEYELYAQFVLENFKNIYTKQYWFNLNGKFNQYKNIKKINRRALSVSYHNYTS